MFKHNSEDEVQEDMQTVLKDFTQVRLLYIRENKKKK